MEPVCHYVKAIVRLTLWQRLKIVPGSNPFKMASMFCSITLSNRFSQLCVVCVGYRQPFLYMPLCKLGNYINAINKRGLPCHEVRNHNVTFMSGT